MMNKKIKGDKLVVAFSAPLNKQDSEFQTYGCRHTNPEICKKNGLFNVCAFVREDRICESPSSAWAKQYRHLVSGISVDDGERKNEVNKV